MAESTSDSKSSGDSFDLSQFYQVFFEEAGENLASMEQQLLAVDLVSADDEVLNSIFRCAHSVKGGAATFGFADVAALTHQMETLLDKLRRHELTPSAGMVDVLLLAGDALKAQLARHQAGGEGDVLDTAHLLRDIAALAAGGSPAATAVATAPAQARPAAAAPAAAPTAAPEAAAPAGAGTSRSLELRVGPLDDPGSAASLVELFGEVVGLGTIVPLDGGLPADGMRRFKIVTDSSDDDLLDLFTFHVSREQVSLLPFSPGYGFHEDAPGAPVEAPKEAVDPGFGFFEDAPGAPSKDAASQGKPEPRAARAAAPAVEAASLRVPVERIDQLINLVGELVITQAMLAQTSAKLDPALYQQMAAGLADLNRNTRSLQESVMSIRMIPMSVVFNRFPRMLRDLAGKLGKKVDFVTEGEATELDKGLVEKITDPLTHLVRNSCDHGIELPAERLARGKSETGTITLAAAHQGGSIVIEVRDDGKGLSRPKLLAKAQERGLDAPDTMTDSEVWSLIFAPGFSTADVVTDISGRGVGMDVVKKNITALGGTVEIESAEGYGMVVRVRLPLTLAIMDGMSIAVGNECYILPISAVVQSFQIEAGAIRTIGGSGRAGRVVNVRGEFMPVVALDEVFGIDRFDDATANAVIVVVEAEGQRAALLVDQLLGQQQVVVKNLESNYRRVPGISGATILGDGHVALILDVGALARRSRH